jgi:hypothetical protein
MAKQKRHLRVVDESNIDSIIINMNTSFRECRDWGHSWRAYTVSFEQRGSLWEETLRCSRCISFRHRKISGKSGMVVKTRYTYRPGYLIPGWGRMSKDDKGALRLAVLEQMLATHGRAVSVEEV